MKNSEKYYPLSDSVFSWLFQDNTAALPMREFINSVLVAAGDEPVREITSLSSQYNLLGEEVGARGGRLDVKAVAENGALFDIEVQLSNQIYMNDRSWFYASKLMSEAFREGEDYKNLPRVRIINLLDFSLRKSSQDFLQPIDVTYRKPPMELASDACHIYNIELPKFRDQYPTLESVMENPLTCWLYLLDSGYKNDHEMEVLTNMTEGMKAFAQKYNRSLDDPKLRGLYELDMSARRDQAGAIYTARVEGKAEGVTAERYSVIRGMLRNGIPAEVICKCIDAPRVEVDHIIAQIRAEDKH